MTVVDEGMLADWVTDLDRVGELIGGRFLRSEPRERALLYVKGLLSGLATRNGWTLAEYVGQAAPDGMQRLLNQAAWDELGVRDDVRAYVVEHLGSPDATLVLAESGDVKKGTKTVGVARQVTAVTGRVENCQVAVFQAYVSPRGQALIDTELYLPRAWVDDPERCAHAGVPAGRGMLSKPQLAATMLHRAMMAGTPAAWVAGDETYGCSGELRAAIEAEGLGYVLAVPADYRVDVSPRDTVRADTVGGTIPAKAFERRMAAQGGTYSRLHAWTFVRLAGTDCPPAWSRHLLVRADQAGPWAYFLCYAPSHTSLSELITVANNRSHIDECFVSAKDEAGLDQHQVRMWTAWYRHTILSMLAVAFLAVNRAKARTRTAGHGRRTAGAA